MTNNTNNTNDTTSRAAAELEWVQSGLLDTINEMRKSAERDLRELDRAIRSVEQSLDGFSGDIKTDSAGDVVSRIASLIHQVTVNHGSNFRIDLVAKAMSEFAAVAAVAKAENT